MQRSYASILEKSVVSFYRVLRYLEVNRGNKSPALGAIQTHIYLDDEALSPRCPYFWIWIFAKDELI